MKNKIKMYIIAIFFAVLLIAGGTFAFWSFTSNNKSIVFNTASNLRKYINYDSGESHFSGTLVVGENYSYGIHSTISVSKSEAASNVTLMGTIYMDINEIGENMRNSSALKWALTSGDSTNVGALLAEGNFIGAPVGDSLILLPSFEVTTTVQKFTVWIWLDQSEHPSEALSGEKLDTNVWVEINQIEGTTEDFIVTQINANYQIITATAVNNRHNIDGYKVTTSAEEPSSWEPVASPSRIYNMPEYSDTQVGQTYYVWFKDTEGHKVYEPIEITQSDTTRPSCTWGTFNSNSIGNGDTATISLTCTDSGSGIVNSNITTSNITTTNEKIQVTNISKEATTGGYIYTITVTGISDVDGVDNLILAADSVKDGTKNGNLSETSGNITISNASVITINAGNGISSITGNGLTYDSNTGKATGTFNNGNTIDLSSLTITYKNGYSGTSYTKASGEGTLSGSTFTVGSGAGIVTIDATTLATPLCTLGLASSVHIYNQSDTIVQANKNNAYDSGVTKTYEFGYTSSSTGILGNFESPNVNSSFYYAYGVSKTLYRGTRYYGVRVTVTGDGGLTATCTTPSGSYEEVTFVNARIDFDAATNEGTLLGTSPLYVSYDASSIYTGRTNATAGTIPIASKTGYTFNGWYTDASGGTKVINADGTLVASVSDWINENGNWILINDSDAVNTNRLYAQFTPQSYTATFYYQSDTTSGSTKVSSTTVSCTVSNTAGNCDVTIPSTVKSSVGTYNNAYAGLSESTGNMTEAVASSDTTITLSASKTYYCIYRTVVTVYEPTSTTVAEARTYYRNQWFTSTSALATTVLSDSQTGTSNWEFVSNVSTYPVLGGYNYTKANTLTIQYSTFEALATSNKTTAYQILRGNIITATYYYNSSTAGDGTIEISTATAESRKRLYCKSTTTAATSNSTFTIPAVVTSSKGPYGQDYLGTANAVNKIAHYNNTAASTYYTYYQSEVANNYYNGSEYADRTLYRTSVFTSKTAMKTVLSTSATGLTNYTGEAGPGSSEWAGLSTAQDTTAEYATVAAAATSTSASLYTIYQFNVSYLTGSNVSSVGAASGNCKVTASDTSCAVTLPSITPSTGYASAGWNTTNGATTGTAAGGSYSLEANSITLYANAISNTYTITLDNQSATTAGTGTIYEKYASGVCLDSSCTTVMTTSTNPITVPEKTGYTFDGYYDGTTQMIDADGHITSSFTSSSFSANSTLIAHWIDDISPTGTLVATLNGSVIEASLTASDSGSGLKTTNTYGWFVSTSSTCDPSVDGNFNETSNSTYSFSITSNGLYYVCARAVDNAGNKAYFSTSVEKAGISTSDVSYSGTWSDVIEEDSENWYAKITGSGTLTLLSAGDIEVFLVGGGASGGAGQQSDYAGGGGGGSGGAIATGTISVTATTYNLVIGDGGTYYNNGNDTTGFGLTAAGGGKGGHSSPSYSDVNSGGTGGTITNGASGGKGSSINKYSKYYSSVAGNDGTIAFSDIKYGQYGGGGGGGSSITSGYITGFYGTRDSGANAPGGAGGGGTGGDKQGAGVAGTANTGGGGGGGGSGQAGGAGGSGIIIIRNARDGSPGSSSSSSTSSSSSSGSSNSGTTLYSKTTTTCNRSTYTATSAGSYTTLGQCQSACTNVTGGTCVSVGSGYSCYGCPNGGYLSGTQCVVHSTYSLTEQTSSCDAQYEFYSCTSGYAGKTNIECTPLN